MSQYNNMEYAQTEYQQCSNVKYGSDNSYYERNDNYDNYDSYNNYGNYNNNYDNSYDNYNYNNGYDENYYNQGNRGMNNQAPSTANTPLARPVRRPVPPLGNSQNMMGQVTPRPSPQIRPSQPPRGSPSLRPVNGRNIPVRNATTTSVPQRPVRPQNSIRSSPSLRASPAVRPSPPVRPQNSIRSSPSLRAASYPVGNIPSRPVPPAVQPRTNSSPQLRPRNASAGLVAAEQPNLKLPVRSQSSLSNLQKQQMPRQPMTHSSLSNSNTLDDEVPELPVPPRTRKHRGSSISSQSSATTENYSIDGNTSYPATPQFNGNIPSNQNGNHYGQNQIQNQMPQYQAPTSAVQPQYQAPTPAVKPQPQQYSYSNNKPLNFHPQAMYNGIGNQYRPPQPKPSSYGPGKLPMTSLGGQPMPYGQSLEMYRQNAKKSNDPHVQLEFAKYLISIADAALDSDPDQKVAQRNQEILYNEGLKWIKKLASQGGGLGKTPYAEAQFFLAECYGNGTLGLQIDHEKAFSYYLQASKQSHPPSTYRAAVCYEHGAGTKKDFQRAVQFYRKAAALGDVLSMYKLGTILLNGTLNQDKNPREAITWLKRAAAQADQTCPHALHELGLIYEGKNPETNGFIVPDPNYSQELYLKAAKFGYSPSQYKLGLCYEYGLLNLPIDSKRSIAWYSKAAEQNHPDAELALSGWYLTGADNVLQQSDKEAFLWARKAANQGLAKAEYAVGYYYENGIGVKKDLEEAKRNYLSAASNNNKRAIARLKEMKAGYAGHGPIQGWREQSRGTGAASEDCVIS